MRPFTHLFPLCPLWLLLRGVLFETLHLFRYAQLHRPKLSVDFRPLFLHAPMSSFEDFNAFSKICRVRGLKKAL